MKKLLQCLLAFALLAGGLIQPLELLAQGTAFTYQGSLAVGGHAASGSYDVTVAIWDSAVGGGLQGGPLTNPAVSVSGGLFTVTVDFGASAFNGQPRWLEIGVRPAGVGSFTVLAPRQACTAAPYAILAASADTAATASTVTGSVAASQITGTLAPSNIAPGMITGADLAANAAAANLNAAGQSGVASSGLVLSTSGNNTNLANAGYVKIYGSFGTPDAWQSFTNVPATAPPSARNSHTAVWTGTEMIVWGGYGGDYLNDGGRYNPAVNSWVALPVTGSTPAARLNHTAVWTGSAMVVWGGIGGTNYFNDGGIYDPVLNAWNYLPNTLPNTPSARLHHTAVWTGSAMIVWGGLGGGVALSDGGLYNPGLNSWTYLPSTLGNTPAARAYHAAVWSGSEMIVWGGTGASGYLADGGRYNPGSNGWIYIAAGSANEPAARDHHTAVWSGTEMITWGGAGIGGDLNDGGRFSPNSNRWIYVPATLAGTPVARESHSAVWTGTEMMVWGGYNDSSGGLVNDGARYNPASNSWIDVSTSLANTPAARYEHSAIWTGTEMVVWGGAGATGPLNDGGRYNPSSNGWIYLPNTALSAPSPRVGHTGVWTGTEMIVWGGAGEGNYLSDGGRFNPALNSWTYLPGTAPSVPPAREYHTAVWTGTQMIVWGGVNNGGFLNDGGGFNPALNAWVYLPGTGVNVPPSREYHTAVWTGTNMIVWGGTGNNGVLNDGGVFDPVAGVWTYLPPTLANTPAPRASHTAVWSGAEMVIWGGTSNLVAYADGGRFNPVSESWIYLPVTLPNTPAARSAQTAVWTGGAMIVWGGDGSGGASVLGDGGVFTPASNSWAYLPAAQANSPAARDGHTAVWTGTEMVVWGGGNSGAYYADGARYNPVLNSWAYIPNTLPATPAARSNHAAVWAYTQMLVWGGAGNSPYNDTFGYTPGRVLYLYQRP